MVKFGLRLAENRSSDYPPDAYLDYDKLKTIINELAGKKLARYVPICVVVLYGLCVYCCLYSFVQFDLWALQ